MNTTRSMMAFDPTHGIKCHYMYVSLGVAQGFSPMMHELQDGSKQIPMQVGIITDEMFKSRYGENQKVINDFPSHIWFNNDFLAFLCGENNLVDIEHDSEDLMPVGYCQWQHRYDPPMREWPEDFEASLFEAKELIRAKVDERQYIWKLNSDNVHEFENINIRYTLGTWVD